MTDTPMLTVVGRQIERVRREHNLSASILAMLAGLTEQQINSIEQDTVEGFVNNAHRIDCARRIALALGLQRDHFLQQAPPPSNDAPAPASDSAVQGVPREQWQHMPLASLTVLAPLRGCVLPPAATERRRVGAPMLVALLVCTALAGLMLALSLAR